MKQFCHILTLLLISALGFSAAAERVPFTMENGLIIVTASVDGEIGNFIFDTGSSDLLLDASGSATTVGFETSNGTVTAEEVQVSAVQVGAVTRPNVKAYEMNLSAVQSLVTADLRGILGGAIFSDHSVYIDFTLQEIQFLKETADFTDFRYSISFEMVDEVPMAEVIIGGKVKTFIIDSGATAHFVDTALLDSMKGSVQQASGADVVTASHTSKQYYYTVSDLRIGSAAVSDATVVGGSFAHLSDTKVVSGLISLRALASQSILFDNVEKKLYFN